MRKFNILHISDSHIQKKDENQIKDVVKKLIDDIGEICIQEGINIDLICFTGDLIQRGDKALEDEEQWNLAIDILVDPLLKATNLTMDNFIFVPGNHEVDTSKIVAASENGLKVNTLKQIKEYVEDFDSSYLSRLDYFYNIVRNVHPDAKLGTLGYTFEREINNIKLGIACVDSAWRSSGKGEVERGKLYISIKQMRELYANIENADFKICLMHHPVEWMENCELLEIEKLLSQYDLVLRGHIHDEDDKQIIRQNMRTIFSTAGKLYPLVDADGIVKDGYNGYSILNIDLEKMFCIIYLRTYYGKNRKKFDAGIDLCKDGKKEYVLSSDTGNKKIEFGLIKGISNYFYGLSEKYNLIKQADSQSPADFKQIFVEPVLADKSEYIKENEQLEQVNVESLISIDDNMFLIGKKESGKTTLLQQIGLLYIERYELKGRIPIYINMKSLPKGEDRIFRSVKHFIDDNILENIAISKNQIKEMINDGKMIFLIDNVSVEDSNHTIWLTKFIEKYNKNRFILTLEEEFFQSINVKRLPEYGSVFRTIYIQNMGKAQIREMVSRWAKNNERITDVTDVVNRIDSYCNQINFAKTPFNISIFMVIWDADNNFIPTNNALIMENYLEIVLEKLSPKESSLSAYSFNLKQNFLSCFAYKMYTKNEYQMTKDEFDSFIKEYHQKKGYSLNDSKFDKIFFDKNILSYSEGYVVFSHTSFLEYFLAVYAFNNKSFLEEITCKKKRKNFRNEICFYAGLNQECTELLDKFSDDILEFVIEFMDLVEELNELEIITEFKMDKEQFIKDLQKNRLSQEEVDNISDKSYIYKEIKPSEITKKDVEEEEAKDLFSLLLIFGSVIKNAELVDNQYKIAHLEIYMYGMNILYAIVVKLSEYMKKDYKYEKMTEEEKRLANISSKDEFDKKITEAIELTKLLFPIGIQNLILENVGSPKLVKAIDYLVKTKEDKSFEKFMLAFLKCDMKVVSLKGLLETYIKKEKSKSILKIMLIKLTFYYQVHFFGNNVVIDKELIDLIAEIQMRLNPIKYQNFAKSQIIKEMKFQLDQK